ncbi:hypothetical protein C0991_005042, partial [Blastosporella zonata]
DPSTSAANGTMEMAGKKAREMQKKVAKLEKKVVVVVIQGCNEDDEKAHVPVAARWERV